MSFLALQDLASHLEAGDAEAVGRLALQAVEAMTSTLPTIKVGILIANIEAQQLYSAQKCALPPSRAPWRCYKMIVWTCEHNASNGDAALQLGMHCMF